LNRLNLEEYKRELLENEEEKQFFNMTVRNKGKYTVVDRRHLKNILEEQKLSSSGITDIDTVKLGKILNLDVIVLRLIYEESRVTKVLKVDTGEVLFFKTYETEKTEKTKIGNRWIYYRNVDDNQFYYDKYSITKVSPRTTTVLNKMVYSKVGKDKFLKLYKDRGIPTDDLNMLNYSIFLLEIGCFNNTFKVLTTIHYDDGDKILVKSDEPTGISHILPGSAIETLVNEVCNK
jgi:hypothetical protein